MLIRLLQQVHGMRLAQHVAPDAVPPPGWADSLGSDGSDEVIFKHHLTIYVQVCVMQCVVWICPCVTVILTMDVVS